MSAAVDIQNLSVVIDKQPILQDISTTIDEGAIVGLLGPSGAGKTTLIRAILGLQKPARGAITVLGMEPGSRQLRSHIGYVTQTPSVYFDLTVLENIQYFASFLGVPKQEVLTTINVVELKPYMNVVVGNLSGGQKARVSLAVALLGKPRLLLLDEPTVGLDPVLRQNLWKLFRNLSGAGTTILLSSHVMDEADKCDALMFIRGGKLLISDTKKNVLTKTKTSSMEDAFLKLAVQEET